jgi:UDP-N-acetylglucosamine--N-acetylmuramyl-(pentapeptide) pyrophosphoryl-undecaprenol N-acetylglucosamine transferase
MPIVTFLGGSQGSRQINSIVQDILPSLQGKAFVVHQTGKDLFDKRIHNPQAGMYAPLPYIGREISDILAATTVAVGRAGAGTVWECASLGIPMVLIPLSGKGTRGDQVENAAMASSVGAAACLTGEDSTPGKVLKAIQRFLDSPFEYSKAQSACKRLTTIESNGEIPLHSADFIANLILARLAEESGGKL